MVELGENEARVHMYCTGISEKGLCGYIQFPTNGLFLFRTYFLPKASNLLAASICRRGWSVFPNGEERDCSRRD
jgi:hypothetical protein